MNHKHLVLRESHWIQFSYVFLKYFGFKVLSKYEGFLFKTNNSHILDMLRKIIQVALPMKLKLKHIISNIESERNSTMLRPYLLLINGLIRSMDIIWDCQTNWAMSYINFLTYKYLHSQCHYTWQPGLDHPVYNGDKLCEWS